VRSLSVVAWRSYESGNLKSAKGLYERALRIFQRANTETAAVSVLIRLGLVLERNHEYSDAATYYGRGCQMLDSIELQERTHRLKVRSLYHLGRIRRIQRSHQEAELMLKKAVEYAEQNLGHHDMEFACALNQLAKELSELLDVVTVT
jgi:tetratricopeptide (TPR) repeat protein